MATTQFGVNHPLAVKLFSKKLFHEALKDCYISQFTGKSSDSIFHLNPELKEVGDKLTYGLRVQMSGDGVQGDATLEGNEEALSFYDDSILINQLRHATRSSGKMSEQRVPYSMREEARMGLSDWFADRLDVSMFNQIAGNTGQSDTKFTGNNSTVATDSTHWILATASTGEGSLSASSVFSLTMLDKAVVQAKTISPKMRPVRVGGEKKYVCWIHPYQHYQLRTNTNTAQYMDIQKAALTGGKISNNPIYTGALAEYNGVILHESTRVPWGIEADNTAHPKTAIGVQYVARAIVCGAQAGVICTGRQTKAGMDATWREEMFDYGNQLGVGAGMIFGIKKSVFNSKDFSTIVLSSYSPNPNA